jgi:hypothetical protein
LLDRDGKAWLVDWDRAEAAAGDLLLDRDAATLLPALERVADPALIRATAEQALGQEVLQRAVPLSRSTPAAPLEEGARLEETRDRPPR